MKVWVSFWVVKKRINKHNFQKEFGFKFGFTSTATMWSFVGQRGYQKRPTWRRHVGNEISLWPHTHRWDLPQVPLQRSLIKVTASTPTRRLTRVRLIFFFYDATLLDILSVNFRWVAPKTSRLLFFVFVFWLDVCLGYN